MKYMHAMPFGAKLLPAGGTRFRLWAPGCARVELQIEPPDRRSSPVRFEMRPSGNGWHEYLAPGFGAGSRYRFAVPQADGITTLLVPDPASRSNPDGVHGPSVVVDPAAYDWHTDWQGRPWHEAVIYEMHVGTFTPEGSFDAARERLAELADLGITAVELMPVAAFPGRRGWGYDGVLPFAPAACYGTPEDLKAFIDAAHAERVMVLLDVVYNHFGPEGNYLPTYAPQFFNPAHRTPWGDAINFDGAMNRTVRSFFIHNVLYWLQEYRFDGLRLDAVHAIQDGSIPDIVRETGALVRHGCTPGRQAHLLLENHSNEAHYLARGHNGQPLCATAQWNDDVHHALHVIATGEADGYYADYAAAPLDHLGRALAEGFSYQGQHSAFLGDVRGEPSAHLPPDAFIAFLQNHDQVGNRAFGERLPEFAGERLLHAAYGCLLLAPQVPMLFMGEEFRASTPFLYFCDFGGDLAKAVANGRRNEFSRFAAFADEAARARIPDPNAEATFAASVLKWAEREQGRHGEQLALVKHLLDLRRRHLVPRLAGIAHGGHHHVEGELLRVEWRLADLNCWRLLVNFSVHDIYVSAVPAAEIVHAFELEAAEPAGMRLASGGIVVSVGPCHG